MAEKRKTKFNDVVIVMMVVLMGIAANLPESYSLAIDRRFLLAGLAGIVVISLIKYLKFTLVLVVFVLAIGANLPEQAASKLGVDSGIMLIALLAMLIVSLANQIFKLPTGVPEINKPTKKVQAKRAVALFNAIGKGRASTVHTLLDQGVNPNIKTKGGQTPLMYAASKGHTDLIKLLLERGADINATDTNGITALRAAQKRGHSQAIEMLKASGAQR